MTSEGTVIEDDHNDYDKLLLRTTHNIIKPVSVLKQQQIHFSPVKRSMKQPNLIQLNFLDPGLLSEGPATLRKDSTGAYESQRSQLNQRIVYQPPYGSQPINASRKKQAMTVAKGSPINLHLAN